MLPRLLPFCALLALAACDRGAPPVAPAAPAKAAVALEPVRVSADIAAFYRERGSRPLWVTRLGPRPEALRLAEAIARAADHGLDPSRYGSAEIAAAIEAARSGDPAARARADLLLSRAYPDFVRDLRLPARGARGVTWVDEELAPEAPGARALLEAAAVAPDLGRHLAEATATNPLYAALSRGYARRRAAGPRLSAAEEQAIRANLDRARLIPALRGRYVIVDTGSARLWMIDGDRVDGPMRVIVGKPNMQTPTLAGYIRYVTLNPWWNVPPDLARERAKRVLKSGPVILRRENLELLSDWSDRPRVIGAAQVDWKAVASGRTSLRMRQRPGGNNVMGAMKFMLPNRLGIYLHDFPDKSLFRRSDRRISSGCVRLEDAPRLARFLFRGAAPRPSGPAPEQRVDLPEPVPVFITYLTALPDPARGVALQKDVYARDERRAPGRRA
ncbi:MAG TPA: L,D-transpeptidase family protein [Allosphingosinicella sp.]|jgi:murein L,D-transpeptidase YcbB/YkuD|nr:L,D-transpeptidase family protein [Allosphingosinicella sp.]